MVNFRFGVQPRPSGWTAFVFTLAVGVVVAGVFTRLAANEDQRVGATSGPQKIVPGAIWPDDRGEHVQAHGGGVIQQGDTYFWFGEHAPGTRSVQALRLVLFVPRFGALDLSQKCA